MTDKKRGRLVYAGGTVLVERVRADGLPDARSESQVSLYHQSLVEREGLEALRQAAKEYYGGLVLREVAA